MKKIIILSLLCCLLTVSTAFAKAFESPVAGIRGIGMGTAGIATGEDATAVYYNPAALTQLQPAKVYYEVALMNAITDYEFTDTAGGTNKSDEKSFFGDMFFAYSTGDLAFGCGAYVPYGMGGVKYEGINGIMGFEESIGTMAFALSAAYKVTPKLSVGVAGEISYGMLYIKTDTGGIVPSMDTEAKADGITAPRAMVSAMYTATPDLNIGGWIKSPATVKLEGDIDVAGVQNLDYSFEVDVPWMYGLGISYRINPKLLIASDFIYRDFSSSENTEIEVNGVSTDNPTHWKDVVSLSLGAEYAATTDLKLRAGIVRYQGGTDPDYISVASANDNSETMFTAGAGYQITPKIELQGAVLVGIMDHATADTGEEGKAMNIIPMIGVRGTF